MYAHVFQFPRHQGLGGQDMLHLGSTYTHGKSGQRAVRGSVGIAAHYRHTGQARALLRADDMNYTLSFIRQFDIGNAPFPDISVQGIQLLL